jgi:hypothetical protein
MSIYKKQFDGDDYQPARDDERLSKQIDRVFACMKDAKWRTLGEIATITGDPEASISAQLRHLRKGKFGTHTVHKNYRGSGLYEYQVLAAIPTQQLRLV